MYSRTGSPCTDRSGVTFGQNSEKTEVGLLCGKKRDDPSRSLGVPWQMLVVVGQSYWECVANRALTAL